jgi:hypothetical protein
MEDDLLYRNKGYLSVKGSKKIFEKFTEYRNLGEHP